MIVLGVLCFFLACAFCFFLGAAMRIGKDQDKIFEDHFGKNN